MEIPDRGGASRRRVHGGQTRARKSAGTRGVRVERRNRPIRRSIGAKSVALVATLSNKVLFIHCFVRYPTHSLIRSECIATAVGESRIARTVGLLRRFGRFLLHSELPVVLGSPTLKVVESSLPVAPRPSTTCSRESIGFVSECDIQRWELLYRGIQASKHAQ